MLPLCTKVTEIALVLNRVFNSGSYEALGTLFGDWLDADAAVVREANLVANAHFVSQPGNDLLGFGRIGFPFDASIDVFGVFSEKDDVDILRPFQRCGRADVLYGTYARIQVEEFSKRHVEAADAAADGCGQRALNALGTCERLQRFHPGGRASVARLAEMATISSSDISG